MWENAKKKWNPSTGNTQYLHHNIVHVAKPFTDIIDRVHLKWTELSKPAELSESFLLLHQSLATDICLHFI